MRVASIAGEFWLRQITFTTLGQLLGQVPFTTIGQLLGPVRYHSLQASPKRDKGSIENRWRDFFADPSQWWDHRCEKSNPRFPDFKHKEKRESLWLDCKLKPTWVEAELAAIRPGELQTSVFSWNQRLSRYSKSGQYEKTIELLGQMQRQGIDPDRFTFVPVLNACARAAALEEGRRTHKQIILRGYETVNYVGNSLVDMYAKCGSMEEAQRVFNKMPRRDVVAWTAMTLGYVKCGEGKKAIKLIEQMHREGVKPDSLTFVAILNACASQATIEEGRYAHKQIIRRGYESNVFVGSSLVDMYAKCGSMGEAQTVFSKMPERDVVAWTAMILGYANCGEEIKALTLYQQMQAEGVSPDRVTFVSILNACASLTALDEGQQAHKQIVQLGYDSDISVSNCLIGMYAKCGSMEDARRVFDKMPTRDVVSWTTMLTGYVKCGQGQLALELSQQMEDNGVDPDPITFVAVLSACASMAAHEDGRRAHEQIIQRGYESDVFVGSSLVDMYAKCGSIEDAWRVFDKMPNRDVIAWSAMLAGYGRQGYAKEAIEHFNKMCKVIEVDGVTFISLLSACSHGGFVDEGLDYFESMSAFCNVSPVVGHYACVVDLLSRAGRLHEAEDVIRTMPIKPDTSVWMSLLAACRVHGNVEMAEFGAKQVRKLDPDHASGYVLLSNIYAAVGKWDSSANVRRERLERGVKILQGCTWIAVNKTVHKFIVDDKDHPKVAKIHEELDRLSGEMKDAGFMQNTRFKLQCVDEERAEFHLCYHSEILAVAFGLISTAAGTPLRIVKNLHICGDCHAAMKVTSKIVGRAIIFRAASHFHHFQDGLCSCRDFW